MNAAESEIIALERHALDRWGNGDPGGFTDLYAPTITYFDPATPARIEGRQAMVDYYRPYVGQIFISRYEILNPEVVVDGNLALLTYNLVNFDHDDQGNEVVGTQWNSTTVYRRVGGAWKAIHSHWSFTRHPALVNATPDVADVADAASAR